MQMSCKDVSQVNMVNLKEGGLLTGIVFSLADRWAYTSGSLRYLKRVRCEIKFILGKHFCLSLLSNMENFS